MAKPSACNMKVRIAFAAVGLFVGLSVFFPFGFHYHNWDTACFGLASGVVAAITLMCHVRYNLDEWKRAPDLLSPLMMSGCFIQLLGVVSFTVYLVLGITQHLDLTPYGPKGYYLTCVWCFMTWKWGFALFYFTRQYRQLYRESTGTSPDVGYDRVGP